MVAGAEAPQLVAAPVLCPIGDLLRLSRLQDTAVLAEFGILLDADADGERVADPFGEHLFHRRAVQVEAAALAGPTRDA